MPTRATEYSLYTPGKLITSTKDIYNSSPIDGDAGNDSFVACGTVGMIVQGPTEERRKQYLVQFVRNIVWWVNASEIEPYILSK
jgi:hypothetical protein|tara:strand:- start:911 stop:1162 length:252 start_codon:yes stop_codon:yes gene_type:complete